MEYAFNLYFDELNDELQDQKIDEMIEYNYDHHEYETDENRKPITLEDCLENLHIRDDVREYIKTHFPIYF